MLLFTHRLSYLSFLVVSLIFLPIVTSSLIISTPFIKDSSELSGDWQYCPEGKYATVFQLKYVKLLNLFGIGLSSVALYCNTPTGVETSSPIISYEGVLGSWGSEFYCEGLLTGFSTIRSYGTSIRNFKGFCATLNSEKSTIEGHGESDGDWTPDAKCLPKQAICGLRTHYRRFWILPGDEITNIEMKCCDIPNPVANCEATDRWGRIIDFNNLKGYSPMSISFEKIVGVRTTIQSEEAKILASIGFTEEDAVPFLAKALTEKLANKSEVHHQWSSEPSQIWSTKKMRHELEKHTVIKGGIHLQLYQVVGECSDYIVYSTRFKRLYTDSLPVENMEGANASIFEFTWAGEKILPISKDFNEQLKLVPDL